MATVICTTCEEELPASALLCPCGADTKAARSRRPERRTSASDVSLGTDQAGRGAGVLPSEEADARRCPAEDCGFAVPDGADACPYCLTPVTDAAATDGDEQASEAAAYEADDLQASMPVNLRHRLRIVEPLPASGAEADLYIVADRERDRRSVLKLYRRGVAVNTGALERLARADIAHVVGIEDHGPAGDRYYELLEFIEAGHLRAYQERRSGKLKEREVRQVLTELADALEHLHGMDLRHGDVKPENILVRKDTRRELDLVFTDFGLAAVVEHTIVHGADYRRSRLYSAPEQLSGVQAKASDVWGLGVVVLELLLGRHPLSDPADGSLDSASSLIDYRFLYHQWPIPPDQVEDRRWQLFFRGVLHPDPERRWRIEHVQAWLAGRDVPKVSEPAPPRAGEAFDFNGRTFTGAAALAEELVRVWGPGSSRVESGAVRDWIRARGEDKPLAKYLEELPRQRWDRHGQLLRAALRMNPELPPVYQGFDISIQGLRALASQAVNAGRGSPEADVLDSLIAQHGLAAVGDLTGSVEHARLARDLREGLNRLSQLFDDAGRNGVTIDGDQSQARYRLLQLLTDPRERDRTARRVRRRAPRDLPPWYTALLDADGAAELVVASAFREVVLDERKRRRTEARAGGGHGRTGTLEARLAGAARIAAGLLAAGASLLAPIPTILLMASYAAVARYRDPVRHWFNAERRSRWTPGRFVALPFSALGWVLSAVLRLLRDALKLALAGGLWLAAVLFAASLVYTAIEPTGVALEDVLRRVAVPALAFQAGFWLTRSRAPQQGFGLTSQLEARVRSAPPGVAIAVWVVALAAVYAGWAHGVEDPVAAFEEAANVTTARLDDWAQETFGGAQSASQPTRSAPETTTEPETEQPRDRWRVQGVVELNVRESPGLESPVVARLREGQIRSATGNTDVVDAIEWVELQLPGGRVGWASQRYLERLD